MTEMNIPKTQSDIENLIRNGVEESHNLEYKSAEALLNTGNKENRKDGKAELIKDVSAMANAAGGIIIYGVKEFDDPEKKHLPEKITPIERTKFSKEQLEHIIRGNISPTIDGLRIHPIQIDSSDLAVYVVEIPQSTTAH